jgi:hypothetical protein
MASTKSKSETSTATSTVSVEVRVWVQGAAKEIIVTVDSPTADVSQSARDAMSTGTIMTLSDKSGRTVVLAGDRVAAIEVGAQTERRVGFAT